MPKPKLLIVADRLRTTGVDTLREQLDELQRMSDAGDRRPEVYATYIAILTEIERRKLKTRARPETLIRKSAVYLMRADELRSKIAELMRREQTEIVRNTISLLSGEIGRRSLIARDRYARRKAEAKAFMEERV